MAINEFQKARITLIAFLYGSVESIGFVEVEDMLLISLNVMGLICILQKNKPRDCKLKLKYKACNEFHDINCFWVKCSVFEKDPKVQVCQSQ